MPNYAGTTSYQEPWTAGPQRLANTLMQIYKLKQDQKRIEQQDALTKLGVMLKAGETLGFTPEMKRNITSTGKPYGITTPDYSAGMPDYSMGMPTGGTPPAQAPAPMSMPEMAPGTSARVSEQVSTGMGEMGAEVGALYRQFMGQGMTSAQAIQLARETARDNITQRRYGEWSRRNRKIEEEYGQIVNLLTSGKIPKGSKAYKNLAERAQALLIWRAANQSPLAGLMGQAAPQNLLEILGGNDGGNAAGAPSTGRPPLDSFYTP